MKTFEKKFKELEMKYNKLLASGAKKGTEAAVMEQLADLDT